jgi:hypothetical protein
MSCVSGQRADFPTFTLIDAAPVSNDAGDAAVLLMTKETGPLVFLIDPQSILRLRLGLATAEKFLQSRSERVVVRAAVRVGAVAGSIAGKKK